jgi:cytolysin-activating lysine-acyltransferase
MDELLDTLSLYKFHYPLWFDNSLKEIFYHIYPSLILGQYKVHTDEDGLYGFRNWAFLSEEAEQKYLKTREIDFNDWNSGDSTWVIDTIFKRKHNDAMIFYKTFFTHLLGPGKPVQWLRLAPNGLVRSHMSITTKEHML